MAFHLRPEEEEVARGGAGHSQSCSGKLGGPRPALEVERSPKLEGGEWGERKMKVRSCGPCEAFGFLSPDVKEFGRGTLIEAKAVHRGSEGARAGAQALRCVRLRGFLVEDSEVAGVNHLGDS